MHQRGQFFGIAIAGALVGLSAWFHVGPYRWAVDAQLRMINAYYPFWTWVGLLLLFGLPLGLVTSEIFERWNLNDGFHDWYARYGWLVLTRTGQLMSIGLILAIAGSVMSTRAMMIGPQTELSVIALEHGAAPSSEYVLLVDGEPDPSSSIEFDHRTYVPVFGENDRATVFLEMRQAHHGPTNAGLISEGSLPNVVRAGFEDEGMLADRHYVIEAGNDPDAEMRSDRWLAIAGLVLFAIGGIARLIDQRRRS